MRSFYTMRSDLRRLFGLSVLTLFATGLSGQTTVSPYSIFGNGERESGKFAQQLGMGTLSTGVSDSLQVNFTQPASYASIKYTTVDIGGFYQETWLRDASSNSAVNTNSGGFNYLALGFPLGKGAGMSFGLLPYSKVGYDIEARTSTTFSDADIAYQGEGGFDRVYVGFGVELIEGLSVGLNGSYLFGSSERLTTVLWDNTNYYNITREENVSANGLTWDAGVQYKFNVGSKYDMTVGASYVPKITMGGTLNDLQYTFRTSSSGTYSYKDTVFAIEDENVNVVFNSNTSFGFTFGARNQRLVQHAWSIGADFQLLNRSELNSSSVVRGTYENGYRVNVGAQLIPYFSFDMQSRNYFSQIDYRIGGFYENSGLLIAGEAIVDQGLTVGFGFPIGRRTQTPTDIKLATLNVGMILGSRGTNASGNIQETYSRFVIGLTLNDKWFTQFKYR